MNGRGACAGDQNYRFLCENRHSTTLRVGRVTGTVTKLLNQVTQFYLSQQ
jgi:hypothetical protein